MEAVLIQNPPFSVLLRRQPMAISAGSGIISLVQRVRDCVKSVFVYIQFFFTDLWCARRGMLFYVLIAARISVGVSLIPAEMAITAVISVAIMWVGVATVLFVVRVYKDRRTAAESRRITTVDCLEYMRGSPVDPKHLQAKQLKMDMSVVPPSLKIEVLKELLSSVPMTLSEKELPGYIKEPTLEDTSSGIPQQRVFSKEELITLMQRLVDNINQKRPWLGVPNSAQDKAGCERFYQKLSDLLRFTLYKVTNDIETFITNECKGTVPEKPQEGHPDSSQLALFKKYNNLVEDRNRFLVDIACVGNYCGGRAMGEALDAFCRLTGQSQEDEGSLEERIAHILISKRLEIIRADVAAVYPNNAHSTHYFAAYLSQLGEALGIPGSDEIVEHLQKVNNRQMLVRFFWQYTPKTMTQAIVDKYNSSESFRHLVIDWFKQQVGSWNQSKYDEAYTQIHLEEILQDQQIVANAKNRAVNIYAWLKHLKGLDDFKNQFIRKEDGSVAITIDNEEKLLHEVGPEAVMTELFSLSRKWVQGQSDLWKTWETLQEAIGKLPADFAFPDGSNNVERVFEALWNQTQFKDNLRTCLVIEGEQKTPEEIVKAQNEAFSKWVTPLKNAALPPKELKEFILNKVQNKVQKQQQAVVAKKLILDRVINESIKNSWKTQVFCPEFIELLETVIKGSQENLSQSLEKSFQAQEQLGRINQQLIEQVGVPIPENLRGRFVDAIQKNDHTKLEDMIKSHLQKARELEFFSALMKGNNSSHEEDQKEFLLTEDMGRWLLISHGVLLY